MRLVVILLIFFAACGQQDSLKKRSDKMYEKMRLSMVEDQIVRRGVQDENVINAMRKVPRHEFVPDHLKKYAYADEPLPIGEDQTISQPYIVAYMTENLHLKPGNKVLEIGTGSGYQAAVLAEIIDTVYTIEIVDVLARSAKATLDRLGYDNVFVKTGDGYKGWAEYAPYDAIILTAAPTKIPEPLLQQLKVGGLMILPIGEYSQVLELIVKNEQNYERKELLPVRFVPMTGEVAD
ncbi:MAG: protein-L-isoaspartate(D-aspartate) O-methyltransferase [Calditrichales bacterium]|nr:MAG: protein-L-isoaspartate(D-aspartate) O-methyltransferase [Calditrichales bacterium]